jgi:hypothetical protein
MLFIAGSFPEHHFGLIFGVAGNRIASRTEGY